MDDFRLRELHQVLAVELHPSKRFVLLRNIPAGSGIKNKEAMYYDRFVTGAILVFLRVVRASYARVIIHVNMQCSVVPKKNVNAHFVRITNKVWLCVGVSPPPA